MTRLYNAWVLRPQPLARVRFELSGWARLTPTRGPEQFCAGHYEAWCEGRWFSRWCRACAETRKGLR